MRKTREVFEYFDIDSGGTIESGTKFTCFTGTKVQIMTQFLRRRAGDDDEVARYIPLGRGDTRAHRGSKASKAVVKLVKQSLDIYLSEEEIQELIAVVKLARQ